MADFYFFFPQNHPSYPPPLGRMFHWPVIFIVALQNETVGSSRACMEAKINTAISDQDLSGLHLFSGVTEEQLHLSGEFNCET